MRTTTLLLALLIPATALAAPPTGLLGVSGSAMEPVAPADKNGASCSILDEELAALRGQDPTTLVSGLQDLEQLARGSWVLAPRDRGAPAPSADDFCRTARMLRTAYRDCDALRSIDLGEGQATEDASRFLPPPVGIMSSRDLELHEVARGWELRASAVETTLGCEDESGRPTNRRTWRFDTHGARREPGRP